MVGISHQFALSIEKLELATGERDGIARFRIVLDDFERGLRDVVSHDHRDGVLAFFADESLEVFHGRNGDTVFSFIACGNIFRYDLVNNIAAIRKRPSPTSRNLPTVYSCGLGGCKAVFVGGDGADNIARFYERLAIDGGDDSFGAIVDELELHTLDNDAGEFLVLGVVAGGDFLHQTVVALVNLVGELQVAIFGHGVDGAIDCIDGDGDAVSLAVGEKVGVVRGDFGHVIRADGKPTAIGRDGAVSTRRERLIERFADLIGLAIYHDRVSGAVRDGKLDAFQRSVALRRGQAGNVVGLGDFDTCARRLVRDGATGSVLVADNLLIPVEVCNFSTAGCRRVCFDFRNVDGGFVHNLAVVIRQQITCGSLGFLHGQNAKWQGKDAVFSKKRITANEISVGVFRRITQTCKPICVCLYNPRAGCISR